MTRVSRRRALVVSVAVGLVAAGAVWVVALDHACEVPLAIVRHIAAQNAGGGTRT